MNIYTYIYLNLKGTISFKISFSSSVPRHAIAEVYVRLIYCEKYQHLFDVDVFIFQYLDTYGDGYLYSFLSISSINTFPACDYLWSAVNPAKLTDQMYTTKLTSHVCWKNSHHMCAAKLTAHDCVLQNSHHMCARDIYAYPDRNHNIG